MKQMKVVMLLGDRRLSWTVKDVDYTISRSGDPVRNKDGALVGIVREPNGHLTIKATVDPNSFRMKAR